MKRAGMRVAYVRMSQGMHRSLRVRAAEEDRTLEQVMVSALQLYLKLPAGAAPSSQPRPRRKVK